MVTLLALTALTAAIIALVRLTCLSEELKWKLRRLERRLDESEERTPLRELEKRVCALEEKTDSQPARIPEPRAEPILVREATVKPPPPLVAQEVPPSIFEAKVAPPQVNLPFTPAKPVAFVSKDADASIAELMEVSFTESHSGAAVRMSTPLQAGKAGQPRISAQAGTTKASTSWTDFESRLGQNWLNKVGVSFLVIGISLLIGYTFQYLGPAGKIAIGYLVSVVLLAGGVWLESKKDFGVFAKGLIGGGWAMGYFTTYAVHFIQTVRLVDSELVGLSLLGICAAGMIGHSLRYRSETVTSLAYFLAFTTVALSNVTAYSLVANLVLTGSLVFLCVRMQWIYLALAGLVATYLLHFAWLFPLVEAATESGTVFNLFWLSALLLLSYWSLFLLPNFLLKIKEGLPEASLQVLNLLNFLGFVGLMSLQATHTRWRFQFAIVLGLIYLLMAALSRRRMLRSSYLIFTTLGVALLVGAVPFRFSGDWLTVLWLLESEVLLLTGVFLSEVHFRRLSWGSFVLAAVKLLTYDLAATSSFALLGVPVFNGAVTSTLAAFCFYFNAYWLPRRFGSILTESELVIARVFSYAAALSLSVAIYLQSATDFVPFFWCLLATGLLQVGLARDDWDLRMQGLVTSGVAFMVMVAQLFAADQAMARDPAAVSSFAVGGLAFYNAALAGTLTVSCFYVNSRSLWLRFGPKLSDPNVGIARAFSYGASVLLSLAVYLQTADAFLAVFWCVLALFGSKSAAGGRTVI